MNLEELIKELDKDLVMIENEKKENTIYIKCEMNASQSKCPYCESLSNSIHSKYIRTVSDLPIQNNKVKLLIVVRKFFCSNPNCGYKTFSEKLNFIEPKSVKTNRLIEYINHIGLRDSSMDAVRTLGESGIKISSSTVLRIVKKNKNDHNLRSKEYRY